VTRLQTTNDTNELYELAKQHYANVGYLEPRAYKRIQLALRWAGLSGALVLYVSLACK
jgi:hypothetical protein